MKEQIIPPPKEAAPCETPVKTKSTLLEFLLKESDPWPEDFLPERSRGIETKRRVSFA
jgi:hypothetical protein